jgi:uncharacterized membrane protein
VRAGRRTAWALLAAAACAWVALLLLVPGWRTAPPSAARSVAGAVYLAGHGICHQRPERSFVLAGQPMPVCARCTGLYAGGAFGLLVWGLRRRAAAPDRTRAALVRALAIAAVPTAASVIAAWAGAETPNLPRAVTALPLGAAVGAALAAAARGEVDDPAPRAGPWRVVR